MAKKKVKRKPSISLLLRFRDVEQSRIVREAAAHLDMSVTAFVRVSAETRALAVQKEQRAQSK